MNSRQVVNVLLACNVIAVIANWTVTKSDTKHHLAACVAGISRLYLTAGQLLVMDASSDSLDVGNEILARLHNSSMWPILSQVEARPGWEGQHVAGSYVLATSSEHVRHRLLALRSDGSWNSRAMFLVSLRDRVDDTWQQRELVRAVLQQLWDLTVTNVVVLVSTVDSWELYTWFPYDLTHCGGPVDDVVLMDRWLMQGQGRFQKNTAVFLPKVPADLRGCPVTVTTFDWPPFIVITNESTTNGEPDLSFDGLEIKLLHTIADKLNFSLEFVPPHPLMWGDLFPNGTAIGAYSDLSYGRAQIMVASLIKSPEKMKAFENTNSYLTNGIVWFVPRAKVVPRWKTISKTFAPSFWLLILISFFLSSIILTMLSNSSQRLGLSREPSVYSSWAASFTHALAILLSVSVTHQPASFRVRLFFLVYTIYCLQINTAYQSSLISVLTQPGYEPQIDSDESLLSSRLDLVFSIGYEAFMDQSDHIEQMLLRRMTLCKDNIDCLNRAAYKGDMAILSDRDYVNFLTPSRYRGTDGKPLIKPFPVSLMSYFVGMMMSKGNVLLDRFNVVIDRVNQAGLMFEWRRQTSKLLKKTRDTSSDHLVSATGPFSLSILHLQGAFFLLFIGNCLALCIFTCEVTFRRIVQTNLLF